LVVLVLVTPACGDSSSTSVAPSTTGPVTETLNSSLAPNGGSFRVFTASQAGTVTVRLASTNPPGLSLGVGVGVLVGTTDCRMSTSVVTTASDQAQVTASVNAGTYCAGVYDPGTLGSTFVGIVVNIQHP
jgi:hypothetical protein